MASASPDGETLLLTPSPHRPRRQRRARGPLAPADESSSLLPTKAKWRKLVRDVYLVVGSDDTAVVFKPASTAPVALKRGVSADDAHVKEVAAFLLDGELVPETQLVQLELSPDGTCSSTKGSRGVVGSLQRFVDHESSAEDLSSSLFSVEQVQKLSLLDLRVLNLDRHENNILVVNDGPRRGRRLVPIDHGMTLPSAFQLDDVFFCWASWAQANLPVCAAVRDAINGLNAAEDVKLLARVGLRREEQLTCAVMTTLLKKFVVERGMTLAEVAQYVARTDCEMVEPSPLENMVRKHRQLLETGDVVEAAQRFVAHL